MHDLSTDTVLLIPVHITVVDAKRLAIRFNANSLSECSACDNHCCQSNKASLWRHKTIFIRKPSTLPNNFINQDARLRLPKREITRLPILLYGIPLISFFIMLFLLANQPMWLQFLFSSGVAGLCAYLNNRYQFNRLARYIRFNN